MVKVIQKTILKSKEIGFLMLIKQFKSLNSTWIIMKREISQMMYHNFKQQWVTIVKMLVKNSLMILQQVFHLEKVSMKEEKNIWVLVNLEKSELM